MTFQLTAVKKKALKVDKSQPFSILGSSIQMTIMRRKRI